MKRRRGIIAILWLAAVFYIVYGPIPVQKVVADLCPKLLVYNHTASLPVGWYIKLPAASYHVGDIVVYEPNDDVKQIAIERGWLQQDEMMMKKIGALAGMTYSINQKDKSFYIEGKYIGAVVRVDAAERPMPLLDGEYIVPTGNFLPVTSHPRSFDGRYNGVVSLENIKYKVYPIFTD